MIDTKYIQKLSPNDRDGIGSPTLDWLNPILTPPLILYPMAYLCIYAHGYGRNHKMQV